MTQLSDSHDLDAAASRRNRPTSLGRSDVARPLHGMAVPVARAAFLSMLAGCIIPPSLSSGNPDAALNAPPTILSVEVNSQVLPEFSNITFQMGDTTSKMILSLLDTDVDETLYVSMFVDYDPQNAKPPRSSCTTASSGAPMRTSPPCPIAGVCEQEDINVPRQLEIVVFDRMPLDDTAPLYMAMPADGLSATRIYTLKCVGPT